VPAVVEGLAGGGATLVEKSLDAVPAEARAYALGRAIPAIAKKDLASALRMLELLPAQIKPKDHNPLNAQPEYAFGLAAKAILRRMTPEEAAQAATLARRVTSESHRAEALALAARLQPREEAAALWKEVFELTRAEIGNRFESNIAGIAFKADAAVGEQLLGQAEDKLFASGNWQNAMTKPWHLGFYWAQTQPGRARAWLEWGWQNAQSTINGINGPIDLNRVAMAMSAVDIQRALEMADAIPRRRDKDGTDDWLWRWEAKRKIAQYLAAPDNVRRTLNFSRWGATDSWTPSDETGW
jgi:hypothetical protein